MLTISLHSHEWISHVSTHMARSNFSSPYRKHCVATVLRSVHLTPSSSMVQTCSHMKTPTNRCTWLRPSHSSGTCVLVLGVPVGDVPRIPSGMRALELPLMYGLGRLIATLVLTGGHGFSIVNEREPDQPLYRPVTLSA